VARLLHSPGASAARVVAGALAAPRFAAWFFPVRPQTVEQTPEG
jgi:hypothetical protein